MSLRVAVLTTGVQLDSATVQAALRDLLLPVRVRRIRPRLPVVAAVRLARFRPHLLVSDAAGPGALLAALYRTVSPRSRLLVFESAASAAGWPSQLVRRRADALVAQDDQVPAAIERLRFHARFGPMQVPDDLGLFAALPSHREGADAHRLVYAGELSPESGAADVLLGLCTWAEQHPERQVEIRWLGDGDLAGVLETQPLPDNVKQRFMPHASRPDLAACFAECGILVAPPLPDRGVPLAAEALAAGLIVLAARRPGRGRSGAPDFSFDPTRPEEVVAAFTEVLGRSAPDLNAARDRSRMMLQRSLSGPRGARLHAVAAASI